MKTRCGYAAIVGRPNVGKSTLVNALVGQKVSAVTPKPNTTRNRVLAVWTQEDAQVLFLDTPGVHRPRGPLGRYMLDAALRALEEAEAVIWMLDAASLNEISPLSGEEDVVAHLSGAKKPIVAVLNKIDLVRDKKLLLPMMQALSAVEGVVAVVPIAALNDDGIDRLTEEIVQRMPEGPHLYPADIVSDQAERFVVAELVRETLMERTRQEVPYRAAVVVEKFVEEKDRCSVAACIHVEKESHKGIVIGKGGKMIGEIRTRAQAQAEALLGVPVDLRLHVCVTPGWTESPEGLKKMGYE